MPDAIPRGPFDQGLFLTHLNKGRELVEARNYEGAVKQLEEAYLLRPRDPRVLDLLGLAYFRGGKLDKAAEVYRKLVIESPDAHTLHQNLGLILLKLGRLEEAESSLQEALSLSRGSPKVHFYLATIFERQHRHKDAIHHYRQAGAHLMVRRVESKLAAHDAARTPTARETAAKTKPPSAEAAPLPTPPLPGTEQKQLHAVSPFLMAEGSPPPNMMETARFQILDDTLPPGTRARLAAEPPASAAVPRPPGPRPGHEIFRGLEKGLMEVDFSGKVFIKQGTIYSYSGNLNFWVKDKRAGRRPALVIVTGTGRLILTDQDREITFMQVSDETVFVEPAHLLACEESLQPRHVSLGDEKEPVEVVALEGRGMVALCVSGKPLPLSVRPGLPVSVPATAVIMWTGDLTPHVVDDPEVYAVILPAAGGGARRLLRLEGSGRVLVEQTTA
jgi:uncharacterized protein (AIM24 family)